MTRVLWVDHPEGDFGAAIVFWGLCQELGPDNVVDWPYKRSYHGENHVYPLPPGYWNSGQPGFTSPFAWFPAQPGREWSLDEVSSRIGEFDLVVLASPRHYSRQSMHDLVSRVGRNGLRRLVMLDEEDYATIRWDFVEQFSPSVYFKRECIDNPALQHPDAYRTVQSRGGVRIEPLPFATPLKHEELPHRDKTIDILFLSGKAWAGGHALHTALSQAFGSRFVGGHMGYGAYLEHLACARIAVTTRGLGFDTLRYWETPTFEGTMMVADRVPIRRPNPLQDGVHAAYFDGNNPSDLVAVVRRYVDDESRRAEIARAGNQLVREHHTPRARARQLLAQSF